MTNREWIGHLPTQDLAALIANDNCCLLCTRCTYDEKLTITDCQNRIATWLQQEFKEDNKISQILKEIAQDHEIRR